MGVTVTCGYCNTMFPDIKGWVPVSQVHVPAAMAHSKLNLYLRFLWKYGWLPCFHAMVPSKRGYTNYILLCLGTITHKSDNQNPGYW